MKNCVKSECVYVWCIRYMFLCPQIPKGTRGVRRDDKVMLSARLVALMFVVVNSLVRRAPRSMTILSPSLHLCSSKAVATSTSTSSSTASKLWSHRRRSPSSSPSEAPFIVENDLSKLTQALGGLQDVTIEKDSYLFGRETV